MRNYSYRATSSDWTKLYDASVTGDFNGFIQSVNGFPASIIVSATTPAPSDVGVLIDDDPTNITIRASDSENLYARIQNNGSASVLSMLTMPWLIVGGAAPVGSAPTANPVGVSGIDHSGLERALLADDEGVQRLAGATRTYREDWNAALTSSYQLVATTTTATKSLRMSAACKATAYDIEYAVVEAGAAAPTANGQVLLAGDDFLAGIPIGDIYARSATAQKLIVWSA